MIMEQYQQIIALLAKAIEDGRNVTIKADEISINSNADSVEVTMSAPEITVE
jgi:hypothetical protein